MSVAEPHAIARARERYGLDLNMGDLHMLSRACRFGPSRKLRDCSGGLEERLVDHEGRLLVVIYDPVRDNIVTVKSNNHLPLGRGLATLGDVMRQKAEG